MAASPAMAERRGCHLREHHGNGRCPSQRRNRPGAALDLDLRGGASHVLPQRSLGWIGWIPGQDGHIVWHRPSIDIETAAPCNRAGVISIVEYSTSGTMGEIAS